ncbi:MAG TPA: DUF3006 family protein [Pyrinomonadaceae bacterium]|nr:DUF3006 family protein [Pyrinomonadaceae bacterium]
MTRKDHSTEGAANVEVRAVVDRIEDGDIAVLTLDDDARSQLDVPRKRLPEDANSDGDHLLLKFDVDRESGERTLKSVKAAPTARAAAEDRIKKMQERLARMSGGGDDKKDFKL